jgi:hypothetical protein
MVLYFIFSFIYYIPAFIYTHTIFFDNMGILFSIYIFSLYVLLRFVIDTILSHVFDPKIHRFLSFMFWFSQVLVGIIQLSM